METSKYSIKEHGGDGVAASESRREVVFQKDATGRELVVKTRSPYHRRSEWQE